MSNLSTLVFHDKRGCRVPQTFPELSFLDPEPAVNGATVVRREGAGKASEDLDVFVSAHVSHMAEFLGWGGACMRNM